MPTERFTAGLRDASIARLGAWGIELRRGCKDNVITGNTIRDIGAGCVKIGEPEDCSEDVEETSRTPRLRQPVPRRGQGLPGRRPGVWIGQSSGNTVTHNEVSGPFHVGHFHGMAVVVLPAAAGTRQYRRVEPLPSSRYRRAWIALRDLRVGHLAGNGDTEQLHPSCVSQRALARRGRRDHPGQRLLRISRGEQRGPRTPYLEASARTSIASAISFRTTFSPTAKRTR